MATLTNRMETAPASLGSTEIREDLIDIITNVDPVDTPFFSMSGSTRAGSIQHQWQTDTLAAVNAAGHGEGVAHTSTAVGRPSRVENYCQILRKDYSISDSEEAVNKAGFDSAFNYQTMKALKELARNTEAAMIRNTVVTTNSAATPMQMDGLATFIQTNTDIAGSVASLTQANFSALQQTVFGVSGTQPGTCLLSPSHKRAVTTWYSSTTREVGNLSKTLGNSIMRVDTDFGPVNFHMERYGRLVNPTLTTIDELYICHMPYARKAWLLGTKAEKQSRDGDITPGMVMHQLTLEILNELAFGRMTAGTVVTYP